MKKTHDLDIFRDVLATSRSRLFRDSPEVTPPTQCSTRRCLRRCQGDTIPNSIRPVSIQTAMPEAASAKRPRTRYTPSELFGRQGAGEFRGKIDPSAKAGFKRGIGIDPDNPAHLAAAEHDELSARTGQGLGLKRLADPEHANRAIRRLGRSCSSHPPRVSALS